MNRDLFVKRISFFLFKLIWGKMWGYSVKVHNVL